MQLALPLYQPTPSTLIFALERLRAQVLATRPDVGDAAEPVLQAAVGVADHRGVEAGARHHGEPLAVEAADVELAALAAQSDRDGLLDVLRDPEVDGEQVRGARRDDREARRPSRRARRRSAAPSRRRPRRRRARRPRRARAAPAPAPCGSSAPHTRAGPRRLRASSTRRSSVRPPPRRLAGVRDHGDLHLAAVPVRPPARGARRPAGEDDDDQRGDADQRRRRRRRADGACRDTSATWRRTPPSRARRVHASDAERGVREPGREQQREPAVHRDRGGGVTGRIARVRPAGSRAERRAAGGEWTTSVVARYVADSTARAKTTNAAIRHFREHDANERDRPDDDRQHDAAGDDRADQRRVGPPGRPVGCQPRIHVLVRPCRCPRSGSSTRVTKKPRPIESAAITARPTSITTTKTAAG